MTLSWDLLIMTTQTPPLSELETSSKLSAELENIWAESAHLTH